MVLFWARAPRGFKRYRSYIIIIIKRNYWWELSPVHILCIYGNVAPNACLSKMTPKWIRYGSYLFLISIHLLTLWNKTIIWLGRMCSRKVQKVNRFFCTLFSAVCIPSHNKYIHHCPIHTISMTIKLFAESIAWSISSKKWIHSITHTHLFPPLWYLMRVPW